MTDRTELRRLLDEATPGPWEAEGSQLWGPDGVLVAAVREHSTIVDRPDAQLIAAAVNALPGLLDQLDAAEAALARVRELHRESRGSMSALYPNPICECGKDYPCLTVAALGGEQS